MHIVAIYREKWKPEVEGYDIFIIDWFQEFLMVHSRPTIDNNSHSRLAIGKLEAQYTLYLFSRNIH